MDLLGKQVLIARRFEIALTLLVFSCISCKSRQLAEGKFSPIVPGFKGFDQEGYMFNGLNFASKVDFLIKKVHANQLRIAYGFATVKEWSDPALQNYCPHAKRTPAVRAELEQEITEVLNIWLAPLRNKDYGGDKIVKNFIFTHLPTVKEDHFNVGNGYILVGDKKNIDLEILFFCGTMVDIWGLVWPSNSPELTRIPPIIHMVVDQKLYTEKRQNYHLDKKSFNKAMMLERFSLVFGLRSVDNQVVSSDYLASSGAYTYDEDGNFVLTDDDIKGIRWLYKYYHHGNIEDCLFADYKLIIKNGKKRCIPKYPLISKLKHAHQQETYQNFYATAKLLTSFRGIYYARRWGIPNLTEKDASGNNILHYVARYGSWSHNQLGNRHVDAKLTAHDKLGISLPTMWSEVAQNLFVICKDNKNSSNCPRLDERNNEGKLPCDYATAPELAAELC